MKKTRIRHKLVKHIEKRHRIGLFLTISTDDVKWSEKDKDLQHDPDFLQKVIAFSFSEINFEEINNNNNNNFIYIALKSNNCPKRYLITKKEYKKKSKL